MVRGAGLTLPYNKDIIVMYLSHITSLGGGSFLEEILLFINYDIRPSGTESLEHI